MDYRESNGHVTDDVAWPWKVKVMTPIFLGPDISKTTGNPAPSPTVYEKRFSQAYTGSVAEQVSSAAAAMLGWRVHIAECLLLGVQHCSGVLHGL